jgi:hypothetical protein
MSQSVGERWRGGTRGEKRFGAPLGYLCGDVGSDFAHVSFPRNVSDAEPHAPSQLLIHGSGNLRKGFVGASLKCATGHKFRHGRHLSRHRE